MRGESNPLMVIAFGAASLVSGLISGCSAELGPDVIELQPAVVSCSAGGFGDDFDDGSIGVAWSAGGSAGTSVREEAGALVAQLGDSAGNAGVTTPQGYDLTGARVVVEVVEAPAPAPASWAQLQLIVQDSDALLRLHVQGGELCTSYRPEGQPDVEAPCVPYDPSAHRWWSIGEAAGEIVFRAGPTATTDQRLDALPAPFAVDDVLIQLEVGAAFPSAGATARFDNLNPGVSPSDGSFRPCTP